MATQMAVIILLGVWAGRALDRSAGGQSHLWTLAFSLLSVFAAIYFTIRDLMKR